MVIGIVGKYVYLSDTYKSLNEALRHGGIPNNTKVELRFIDSETLTKKNVSDQLAGLNGILVPGGFGERGVEGKILAISYAREKRLPFFGICLGMQLVVVEFARSILGLKTANSREFNPNAGHFLIELMNDQNEVTEKGGTMRLGSYPCILREGSLARKIYGAGEVQERHRHRYEVNPQYFDALEENGLVVSGKSPDGRLAEMVEYKDHPYMVACQFHPEFKSRLLEPHPLFVSFIAASLAHQLK